MFDISKKCADQKERKKEREKEREKSEIEHKSDSIVCKSLWLSAAGKVHFSSFCLGINFCASVGSLGVHVSLAQASQCLHAIIVNPVS